MKFYIFGLNDFPKLITNEPNEIKKPIQFKFENEFEFENEKQIKQISTGSFGTIFLFENGTAIQYLNEDQDYQVENPEEIEIENENIQKVSVGSQIEAILTKEGNIFAKGEYINPNNPNEFINISSLIEDKNDRIIEDIVSGSKSIYLLTSNHIVYGIGSNSYGQLGSDENFDYTEIPILMMKNVSKIFSGNTSEHAFLLDPNEELFVCGNNGDGQLGLGESRKGKIQKLTKIQNIPKGKIIDIQCGLSNSIMMIANDVGKRKLYSCGNYYSNGLGTEKYEEHTYEFTEIKSSLFENDYIIDFSVGFNHTLILTYNSKLIVFGNNEFGQLGTEDIEYDQLIPIQIELPKLRFNENISNYHLSCEEGKSFIYYSPSLSSFFSNLEEDLIKLFRKKRILLNQNENEIEKLQEIISNKSIKESNQIFEMIYSNRIINPILYSEIKEIINSNEKIEETMKRIYLNENENENEKDFIIERKEKKYKFPKLILIMRSELYRGMFLSVTEDTSNKVKDYSELSNKPFQILEYWIYSNQIKDGIQITQEIIDEIQIGIDYFQLNQTNPNLFDLLIRKFNNQN
ncbi:secretion-regulating guanine nucleotide exchange factor [Anaeramoeba ignava]|uniref:Secretion-regulating guanine nucleotide exchange factor n=1 Tax=Anaeramoeba ignava TaxID=1746090 RepID=A0A9Q0R5N8_ANAIG|nr:secretion-regulating guanine nucleotide exchange factor [Anaeramoeba ignava]